MNFQMFNRLNFWDKLKSSNSPQKYCSKCKKDKNREYERLKKQKQRQNK